MHQGPSFIVVSEGLNISNTRTRINAKDLPRNQAREFLEHTRMQKICA